MHFKQHNKLLGRRVCITLLKNVNSAETEFLKQSLFFPAQEREIPWSCHVKHGLSKV